MTEIIDWPARLLHLASRGFWLRSGNLRATALITQTVIPAGPVVQRWQVNLVSTQMDDDVWREIDGLIADCDGSQGLVRLGDPTRTEPYYNTVTPVTVETWDDGTLFSDGTGWSSGPLPDFVAVGTAAARAEKSVHLTGLPASKTAVLRRGDMFEIRPSGVPLPHGSLYIVTRTANSDASGATRVSFKPGLRKGAAVGDMAVLKNPTSVFNLVDDDQGEIQVEGALWGKFGLGLVEVLPR